MRRANNSRRRAVAVAIFAALIVGLAVVAMAGGEEVQRGNLIVSLDGSLSPLALPRHERAPVAVELAGRLRTTDGTLPPRVTRSFRLFRSAS